MIGGADATPSGHLAAAFVLVYGNAYIGDIVYATTPSLGPVSSVTWTLPRIEAWRRYSWLSLASTRGIDCLRELYARMRPHAPVPAVRDFLQRAREVPAA